MEIKERTPKYKFYSALVYLCAYLVIVSFPLDRFLDSNIHYLIMSLLKIALSIFIFIKLGSEGFSIEKFDWKRSLILLPSLLLCGSNLIFLIFDHSAMEASPNFLHLINGATFALATAISEELIFRVMASDVALSKFNRFWTLVITSLIFGAAHLLSGIFGNPLGAILQAGYTVVLGFVVGFTYLYGGSLIMAVLIHFLFNFLNNSLFPILYAGSWNTTFYIVNVSVGFIVCLYLLIVLLFQNKKV